MMLSNALNKIGLILFLVMLTAAITGCSVTDNHPSTDKNSSVSLNNAAKALLPEQDTVSVEEGNTAPPVKQPGKEYTIEFRSSSYFSDSYWNNIFSFPVIQLYCVEEKEVTKKANKSIEKAMTSWISGKVVNPSAVYLSIYCHSERYLSFVNSFEYSANRTDYIDDYITIDMRTGKRVMLNALIEVNEAFVKHIQERNIAKVPEYARGIMDTPEEYFRKELSGMDSADLLKELEECSFTQEQVIANGYDTVEETIGPLVFRSSFFVQNHTLNIILQGGKGYITLDINDIADFLKVDKW